MDENQLEMAERLENAQRERSISEAALRSAPETHPNFDGLHCVECETAIPHGRLLLGKVRCVHCQTIKEKRRV